MAEADPAKVGGRLNAPARALFAANLAGGDEYHFIMFGTGAVQKAKEGGLGGFHRHWTSRSTRGTRKCQIVQPGIRQYNDGALWQRPAAVGEG